jgi:hypothetical protein
MIFRPLSVAFGVTGQHFAQHQQLTLPLVPPSPTSQEMDVFERRVTA